MWETAREVTRTADRDHSFYFPQKEHLEFKRENHQSLNTHTHTETHESPLVSSICVLNSCYLKQKLEII